MVKCRCVYKFEWCLQFFSFIEVFFCFIVISRVSDYRDRRRCRDDLARSFKNDGGSIGRKKCVFVGGRGGEIYKTNQILVRTTRSNELLTKV